MSVRVCVLVGMLAFRTVAHAECFGVSVRGDRELWVTRSGVSTVLTKDVRGIFLPRISPDAAVVVYHTRFSPVGTVQVRLVDAQTGRLESEITVSILEHDAKDIRQLGWRASGNVWLEARVNPSTTVYAEFDRTGRQIGEVIPGLGFAVSPNGKRLAYLSHTPHFTPQDRKRPRYLTLDGVEVTSVSGEFIPPVVWADDGARVTILRRTDEGLALVEYDVDNGKAMTTSVVNDESAAAAFERKGRVASGLGASSKERTATSDTYCSPESR